MANVVPGSSLDRITVLFHFAKLFLLFQRFYNRKMTKKNKYSKQKDKIDRSVHVFATKLRFINRAVVGLMDRALDLKPEVTQGCGFESRLRQEVHDCSPGAAQSAAHCSKCVHLDGLTHFTPHYTLYNCVCDK